MSSQISKPSSSSLTNNLQHLTSSPLTNNLQQTTHTALTPHQRFNNNSTTINDLTSSSGSSGSNSNNRINCSQSQSTRYSNVIENSTTTASHSPNDHKTTDSQTLMHFLKANVGAGVLTMPFAFKEVGLYAGIVLSTIMGFITAYGMNLLIDSHNRLCDKYNYDYLDYDQVVALSFATGPRIFRRFARIASNTILFLLSFSQVGFCCVFLTFVTENLQISMLNLFNVNLSIETYMFIMYPIVAITSSSTNLRYLAKVSTTANVLQITGLLMIIIHLLPISYFETSSSSSLLSQINTNNNQTNIITESSMTNVPQTIIYAISPTIIASLPMFFSQSIYAFEGINFILPLMKEMQSPGRMGGLTGVLNTSMWLIGILYIALGYFGYLKYGQSLRGSITLNLPDEAWSEVVRLFYASAICLTFCIQFYVVWTMVWPSIDEYLFYSYRPREPRGKSKIHDHLAKTKKHKITNLDVTSDSSATLKTDDCLQQSRNSSITNLCKNEENDAESNISTLATSYCVSLQQPIIKATNEKYRLASSASNTFTSNHYGSFDANNKKVRNRLEDLIEDENELMPDIQTRPLSVLSMRGKRKVVRFTLIFVFVALIFALASLVPRIDLVISLIGAIGASSLSLTFPSLSQIALYWNYDFTSTGRDGDENDNLNATNQHFGLRLKRKFYWFCFFSHNLLLVIVGIAGTVTGTAITMKKIIDLWEMSS